MPGESLHEYVTDCKLEQHRGMITAHTRLRPKKTAAALSVGLAKVLLSVLDLENRSVGVSVDTYVRGAQYPEYCLQRKPA